jgi:Fic family protein
MSFNKEAYRPEFLPLSKDKLDATVYFDALIDATATLEVYKEKISDSKLSQNWFLPTLQHKEALASSLLEGTQATLDGVLVDQVSPDDKDDNLREIRNYDSATFFGYRYLSKTPFDKELILELHRHLMAGNVRGSDGEIGVFRTRQNYIGKMNKTHEITFTPPVPQDVPKLIDNLLEYITDSDDTQRPLVRTAIIHAQFETIHPFMDGNGRVGRMLIPLYLYYENQIALPCFFVSEALERDKMKYYTLLNNIRNKGQWSEWINFFLETVTLQCSKYIKAISSINKLYEEHFAAACALARSNQMGALVNLLYKYPVINAATVSKETEIPPASINRYLNLLVEAGILYTDNKSRNRTFYYYDLMNIIRD